MTSILLVLFVFVSCTTEITLTMQKDDSVAVRFEGGAGAAMAKMLGASEGIDTDSVSYELARAGFSDVKVNQKKNSAESPVTISMTDKKQNSYIFSSKIVKIEKGRFVPALTRKSLEDFYAAADEQTRIILDLFLAPVFNNEEMSEAEYLEMLGAFYGENVANEVGQSIVRINLISKDGSKETLNFPLSELLCGKFNY